MTTGIAAVSLAERIEVRHFTFELEHGHAPNVARHHCDNPPCCNPRHISDGTQADNVRDMHERGRAVIVMALVNGAKTHCPAGHPYSLDNTHLMISGGRTRRRCRTCELAAQRIYREARRGA